MVVLVIEAWAYWLLLGLLIVSAAANAWAAWTKHRESAAIKENIELREAGQRRERWLREAKAQAGYNDRVSFDVVWADVLEAHKREKKTTPNRLT